jgi:plasmid stabilization system protein ParE
MKTVTFHAGADAEVTEAAQYYERRSAGLGLSFLREVEIAIEQIRANPEAYERVGDEIRRKLLKRFPYGVLYAVEQDRIRIVAVAHHKRRPHYWRTRL